MRERNGHCHRNGRAYPISEAQRLQIRLKALEFMEWRMIETAAKLEQLRNQTRSDYDGYETKQFGTA